VLFVANLYHDAGKPVVPLNFAVTPPDTGARRLFTLGLSSAHAQRLFQAGDHSAHTWMNRINFAGRKPVGERVSLVVDLLESLEPARAFVVRLLNPEHEDYAAVQTFFETVVQPIIEGELGYGIMVVDGRQPYEHPRIDQEIFVKLHRFYPPGHPLAGQNERAFPVITQYVNGQGRIVWPKAMQTADPVLPRSG
jgi:hypothetical protein